MEPSFWHDRWERNRIGFHERQANPLLVAHFDGLALAAGSRVFVPLCGKTLDIHWLLSRGHRVAGAELSEIAVQRLFTDLGVTPHRATVGRLTRYSAAGLDIFQGDIFDLSRVDLGAVDAVYDRAALIALPEPLRTRYARHLVEITDRAKQLLICIAYDQSALAGPPFSVSSAEIGRLYHDYERKVLGSAQVPGGLKGKCPAADCAWLLTPTH